MEFFFVLLLDFGILKIMFFGLAMLNSTSTQLLRNFLPSWDCDPHASVIYPPRHQKYAPTLSSGSSHANRNHLKVNR